MRRFDPNAGAIVGAPLPVAFNASGVVFDGTDMWVANANGGTVIKYLAN